MIDKQVEIYFNSEQVADKIDLDIFYLTQFMKNIEDSEIDWESSSLCYPHKECFMAHQWGLTYSYDGQDFTYKNDM